MSRLVTIATASHAHEAHLLRGALEAEGIAVVLADEHLIAIDWLHSNAIGGVKVMVREGDVAAALAILEGEPLPLDEELVLAAGADGERAPRPPRPASAVPTCPRCGSAGVDVPAPAPAPSTLLRMLAPLLRPLSPRRARCHACAYAWRP
jgi:hypothetical protein